MLIIGDVHGQIQKYYSLIQKHKPTRSVQVGDFGFLRHHQWFLSNMDIWNHKILFGNHDYMPYLQKSHSASQLFLCKDRIGYIRGAYSIDRAQRIEGRDWWPNEELNYAEWRHAVDYYEAFRPEIMVTHDCPHEVRKVMFGITDKSITSDGLQACFEIHQPRLWVFGHHHQSRREVINGTQFICLAELEALEL